MKTRALTILKAAGMFHGNSIRNGVDFEPLPLLCSRTFGQEKGL